MSGNYFDKYLHFSAICKIKGLGGTLFFLIIVNIQVIQYHFSTTSVSFHGSSLDITLSALIKDLIS